MSLCLTNLSSALQQCDLISMISGKAREEKAQLRFWKGVQLLMFAWSTQFIRAPDEGS